MSLSRKLLESMGLEADKVSTIIEAHAETVDSLKSQIEKYKSDAEKFEGAQKELKAVQIELESLKESGGDWQKKYEKEHADFESFKSSQEAKDLKASKESAYRKLLADSGVNNKRIDTILKATDLSALELENGAFKDAEKLADDIKSEWADFIESSSTSGASTSKPPANDGGRKFTNEEIAQMSAEEINKNWDSIKESMKG